MKTIATALVVAGLMTLAACDRVLGLSDIIPEPDAGSATPDATPDAMPPELPFRERVDVPLVGGVKSASLGDINGDGKLDLIVVHDDGHSTAVLWSVLLNTTAAGATTPSFATQVDFSPVDRLAPAVTVGDVNGDGKPDLLVADPSAMVAAFLDTTATSTTTVSFDVRADVALDYGGTGSPCCVAISDINQDGKPDLVVVNPNAQKISILLNTTAQGATTASFATQVDLLPGASFFDLAISDINGDGKPDLVLIVQKLANFPTLRTGYLAVFLNTTAARAAIPSFAARVDFPDVFGDFAKAALADLNGDGTPDIAFLGGTLNKLEFLMNTTATGAAIPSFTPAPPADAPIGTRAAELASSDIDRDGKPDLVVAGSGAVVVLVNQTSAGAMAPSFGAALELGLPRPPRSVAHPAIGDLNGDGKPDIVAPQFGPLSVFLAR